MSRRVRRRLARLNPPRHAASAEVSPGWGRLLDRRRTTAAVVAAVAGIAAQLIAGPVAATAAAVYTALVAGFLLGRRRERRNAHDRVAVLDAICTLAADLRAGLSPVA